MPDVAVARPVEQPKRPISCGGIQRSQVGVGRHSATRRLPDKESGVIARAAVEVGVGRRRADRDRQAQQDQQEGTQRPGHGRREAGLANGGPRVRA